MDLTRREGLLAGLGLGAAIALPHPGALAQGAAAPAGGPLIRKPIPSSGETIPAIGLGTARRYEAVQSEAEYAPLKETVARFVELGGTVIDTSPTYGTAEAVTGRIVEELGIRDRVFLATKVSIQGAEAGVAQIEDSFRRLRTPRIDLIAVHNLRDTEAHLRTLRGLKEAGRIRYVGLTTSFERQYEEFEAVMRRERVDFIQVDYALDNRKTAERIIPLAGERGMAVMLNLPFGRSRLFEAVRGRELPPWAAEFDCASWAQFFLKYLVSHPAVTCPAPGMAQARYVDDNLGAARGRLPDEAMRRRMEAFIDGL